MGYSKPDGIAAPDFGILNTTSSIVFVHSSLKLNLNVLLVTLEDSKSKTKTNLRCGLVDKVRPQACNISRKGHS